MDEDRFKQLDEISKANTIIKSDFDKIEFDELISKDRSVK